MRPKPLLVIPATGHAQAYNLLVVAEHYARRLVEQGRGPVRIVSQFTGDILATYGEENDGSRVS